MCSFKLIKVIRFIFHVMNVMTITSLVIDIAITIVGEMSDNSFEYSVVYALTASHLILKCSCGYPPVMRRVSSSSYKVSLTFCLRP